LTLYRQGLQSNRASRATKQHVGADPYTCRCIAARSDVDAGKSAVFLLSTVDGCIPSDLAAGETEEIEEERRLLYVAMTRAKHQLDLIVPQRFYVHQQSRGGDRHLYASRTRFLPDALLPLFEQRTWPVLAAEPGRAAARPEARVDIAARLRARWR
jgi:DNA helicase-2/ATP-dependent DNA helicase PcrA